MAADVSSREGEMDLVTRDLLGGCLAVGSNSDDHDLALGVEAITPAWHRPLDLLKRRVPVTLHRSSPDLNQSPDFLLDLRLEGPTRLPNRLPAQYESVCTLEKVKSALARARWEPAESSHRAGTRRSDGSSSLTSSSPSSSITSSSSTRRRKREDETDGCDSSPEGLTAAGCSSCLMYVLISKADPRCPRCDSSVQLPVLLKKPKIDLNFNLNH